MADYVPGSPSWVELSSPDPEASAAFYGALMGWEATEPGPVEETGGYRMFRQGEANVAGLMGHMQPGQPTVWATYFSVEDADATAGKVTAAGGAVIAEPMDVMDLGRMAFFSDPAGAVFGVWQARSFAGADLTDEPNSFCWAEVLTRDAGATRAFYPAVFGWEAARPDFEGAPESYRVWRAGGETVGGMMEMTAPSFPAELPPHWGICFMVADCDAVAAKAAELGATITYEPMTMQIGRFAGLVDPQGASLSVMARV